MFAVLLSASHNGSNRGLIAGAKYQAWNRRHGSNRAGSLTLAGVILIRIVANAPAIRAQPQVNSASPLAFDAGVDQDRLTSRREAVRHPRRRLLLRYTQGRVAWKERQRLADDPGGVSRAAVSTYLAGRAELESDRFSIEAKTPGVSRGRKSAQADASGHCSASGLSWWCIAKSGKCRLTQSR